MPKQSSQSSSKAELARLEKELLEGSTQAEEQAEALSEERQLIEKVADVIWNYGHFWESDYFNNALREVGVDPKAITPAIRHNAEEKVDERWRQNARQVNLDPKERIKVGVKEDSEFDPDINPDHPIKGVAAIRKERARLGLPLDVEDENTQTVKVKTLRPQTKSRVRTENTQGPKRRSGRYEMFGFPATAVFRWMGANGWNVDEGVKATIALGLPVAMPDEDGKVLGDGCSFFTIRGQIWFGSKGKAGDPAELTPEQVSILNKAAGKE